MLTRSFNPPKSNSFFLFGPRGTGKTYFLRKRFPAALFVDLLEDDTFNTLTSSTQRLEALIDEAGKTTVVIDEVQKIPRILDEVHRLIESRKIRFILTGSSARKLKRSGVNLLAGRALTYFMYPLTVQEMGVRFDLHHALQFGTLPLAVLGENPKAYLKSYITTYLKEEIQQEGLTRNLGAFSRFLETAAFSQSQVLNISDVARQCAVERKTVEQYFTIIEDLLLGIRLPIFTRKARRDMSQHPKFFFFDTGVFRALRPRGPLDIPEEIDGAALETLFLQEIRALNDYFGWEYQLYFWRSRSKIEVDLVVYGPKGLVAFEIKRASQIRRDDLDGLRTFREDYPMARTILLYGGSKAYSQDGIQLMPYEQGLRQLSKILA